MSKSRLLASSLLPKGESPFLTIAIPHYKHRRYLEVVLESIFAQNYDFVTCLYHADRYLLPLGFRVVAKTEYYVDKKDGKVSAVRLSVKAEQWLDAIENAENWVNSHSDRVLI